MPIAHFPTISCVVRRKRPTNRLFTHACCVYDSVEPHAKRQEEFQRTESTDKKEDPCITWYYSCISNSGIVTSSPGETDSILIFEKKISRRCG